MSPDKGTIGCNTCRDRDDGFNYEVATSSRNLNLNDDDISRSRPCLYNISDHEELPNLGSHRWGEG
eukprot:scaffold14778_cov151-Skeletonema_dohrnii-CCMP3373.AAC.6